MQTKSNIQLIKEYLRVKESFKQKVTEFMEKYIVEDNVFSYDNGGSGKLIENTVGYFSINGEYTSLDEAFSNMNVGESIRIINNEKFQTGSISRKLDPSKQYYDIETGRMTSE